MPRPRATGRSVWFQSCRKDDACRTLSTARKRSDGKKGFPRKGMPRGSRSTGTQPDMSMTADEGARNRTCSANSDPHISGMTTSDTTRSKPPLMVMISSACSGPGAVVVSYPALSSTRATISNTLGSSSTTKTLALATFASLRTPGCELSLDKDAPAGCRRQRLVRFLGCRPAPTLIGEELLNRPRGIRDPRFHDQPDAPAAVSEFGGTRPRFAFGQPRRFPRKR
jgi:hypothetical protein